jgi:hypothetical protein
MKTELLEGKIKGKIGFLGDEKEMWGVRREIFLIFGIQNLYRKCCNKKKEASGCLQGWLSG